MHLRADRYPKLLLLVLMLLAYSNSFGGGFVLDNRGLLINDERIRAATASNVGLIFGHTYWWPHGESGLYRPLTTLSYLFNYAILGNGTQPTGYHVFNLLVHICNVLLVYSLATRLIRKQWLGFFIAALWAIHPVLTECVTNIAGRADLLAAFGLLAGFLMYLKSHENRAWLIGVALATVIGVFSKESAVVIVVVLIVYHLTFRSRPKFWGVAAIVLPVAFMLYQRSQVLAATQPMEIPFTDNPIAWADFWTGRLTALTVIFKEIGLVFWPLRLSADYSWSQIPLFQSSPAQWAEVILALAVAPSLVLVYRWNRTAFFFLATGLIWLGPAANLLFPTGTIMAERLLYLTALGLIACVVSGVYAVHARSAPAVLSVLIAALAARTWVRNVDWSDDLSIATASVAASPESFKTHDLLANVLFASDPSHSNIDQVIAESETSRAKLEGLPNNRRPADPYRFAANCYMIRNSFQKAEAALLEFVAIEKESGRQIQPDVYTLLSTAYLSSGDTVRAASAAMDARKIDPMNPQVYAQLAEVEANAGHLDQAAVALVEGSFITSDKTLRQDLIQLYERALDPRSCALIAGPNGRAINPACPIVHKHVCDAAEYVVKTLRDARQWNVAEARQTMFDNQFRCR